MSLYLYFINSVGFGCLLCELLERRRHIFCFYPYHSFAVHCCCSMLAAMSTPFNARHPICLVYRPSMDGARPKARYIELILFSRPSLYFKSDIRGWREEDASNDALYLYTICCCSHSHLNEAHHRYSGNKRSDEQ